jgi:ABC-2 type transport system permease protein
MLATPTRTWEVVAGIGLGRFAIAAFQGVFIVVGAWAIFGVDWGDPIASLALVIMFALVGTGAAILVGSTFSNEAQAGPFGIFAALSLAALGGSMVPLELYSDGLRRIAHITPHAWANGGFSTVINDGGGIGDITTELAALGGFAVVLIAVASASLHRALTR